MPSNGPVPIFWGSCHDTHACQAWPHSWLSPGTRGRFLGPPPEFPGAQAALPGPWDVAQMDLGSQSHRGRRQSRPWELFGAQPLHNRHGCVTAGHTLFPARRGAGSELKKAEFPRSHPARTQSTGKATGTTGTLGEVTELPAVTTPERSRSCPFHPRGIPGFGTLPGIRGSPGTARWCRWHLAQQVWGCAGQECTDGSGLDCGAGMNHTQRCSSRAGAQPELPKFCSGASKNPPGLGSSRWLQGHGTCGFEVAFSEVAVGDLEVENRGVYKKKGKRGFGFVQKKPHGEWHKLMEARLG